MLLIYSVLIFNETKNDGTHITQKKKRRFIYVLYYKIRFNMNTIEWIKQNKNVK